MKNLMSGQINLLNAGIISPLLSSLICTTGGSLLIFILYVDKSHNTPGSRGEAARRDQLRSEVSSGRSITKTR